MANREYEPDYCGCCGRECLSADWCQECRAHVLGDVTRPSWERTHYAQFRQPCPFALPNPAKERAS